MQNDGRNLSIIWATLIQYMPSCFSKIQLRPHLPRRLYSSGFRAEVLYEFLFHLIPSSSIRWTVQTMKLLILICRSTLYLEFIWIFLWSLLIVSAFVFALSYTIKVISTYFRRQSYPFLLSKLYNTFLQHSAEIIQLACKKYVTPWRCLH